MIRKYRLKKRLSQKELSKKLGVTQGYISKLENKRINNINRSLVRKLAFILDLDYSDLIRWLLIN